MVSEEFKKLVGDALESVVEKEVEKQVSEKSSSFNVETMESDKLISLLNEIEKFHHDVLDRFVKQINYIDLDNLDSSDIPSDIEDYIVEEHRNEILEDHFSSMSQRDFIELVEENCDVKEVAVSLIERNL